MSSKAFFDEIRAHVFNGHMSQSQVDGVSRIMAYRDASYPDVTDAQMAYVLATVKWETDHTMQPCREIGGSKMRYAPYYGRGLVQLTWRRNYEHYHCENNPDKLLEWPTSLHVLFDGMTKGFFTGKKLSDYISGRKVDYVGARRIINGTDHADQIARLATAFKAAVPLWDKNAASPAPQPKSVFEEIGDFFNPPWARRSAPPANAPPPGPLHGEKTKLASAIVAALGALSVLDWDVVISNPKTGYTLIVSALITSVGHTYLPHILWWILPKERQA
jgi:putative chitinase